MQLFQTYILDVFSPPLQVYLEHRVEVLNVIFDLFNFFHFRYPFLDMIGKIRSLICKVKNGIQNPFSFPK